jgi:hypothetical protein
METGTVLALSAVSTSTVILGIIIVGAVIAAISFTMTRRGVDHNLDEHSSLP